MTFHDKLILDDRLNRESVQNMISKRKFSPSIFFIFVGENINGLLKIIRCDDKLFDFYSRQPVTVLGIASTKLDAIDIIIRILQNYLRVRSDLVDFKSDSIKYFF